MRNDTPTTGAPSKNNHNPAAGGRLVGLFRGVLLAGALAGCGASSDADDPASPSAQGGGGGGGGSIAGNGGTSAGASQAGAGTAGGQAGSAQAGAGQAGAGQAGAGQAGTGQAGTGQAGASGQGAGGKAGAGGGGAAGSKIFFAVIGDFGVDSGNEAAVAEMVKAENPEFVITLGDNNYNDGLATTIDDNIGKYYAEFIHPYKGQHGPGAAVNRFFPCPGNHDWNSGTLDPYLDYFELPGNERYYDFVRGPVHFFAVDSDSHEPDGSSETSTQGKWLQAALGASTSPFKVVYFHHPPYSSGAHGNSTKMQWPFAAWGASAVLTGHDHTYERFTIDGIPYIVNGLGGAGLYQFEAIVPESQVRYNKSHGASFVEATDQVMTIRTLGVNGTLIDEVSITPGATPAPAQTLVAKGAVWRFLDEGATPAGWQQVGFDDASWKQGPAELGYGDGDEATTVSFGGSSQAKRITTYFRHAFTFSGGPALTLEYSLLRDDGAVVYLNGTEVARSNMPAGAIDGSTLASSTTGNNDETTFFKGTLSPSLLLSGQNVVAVEVHQSDGTSSDISFDFELKATGP